MANLVNGGWVKLWRELLSKSIWTCSSPEHAKVLITILLLANHERNEWVWQGEKYVCEPGQLITSAKSIMEACGEGITRQNVRTALKKFEKFGFLTIQSTKHGSLITIVNWGKYQGGWSEPNQPSNHQLTIDQPTANHQLTTNKNDKNNKNDKKDKNIHRASAQCVPPSPDEVRAYCQERGNGIDADEFLDFYQARDWKLSKGLPMRDWKAAVRGWERRSRENKKANAVPTKFTNYEQRSDTDWDSLEQELIRKSMEE